MGPFFGALVLIVASAAVGSASASAECLPGNQHLYDSALCRSEGERCGSDADCLSGVCYLSSCVRDSAGKRCNSDADCRQFFSYSECRDNHCSRVGVSGDKCRNELDCSSELCFGGRCQPLDDGEECSRDVQCRPNSICLGATCVPVGANCSSNVQCGLLDECFVANHSCIRRHTAPVGTVCVGDNDCQPGLVCGREQHKCVIPSSERLGAGCLLSTDCATTDSQECACTHYPSNAYRCVSVDMSCIAQQQEYSQCMKTAGCSMPEAALSLRTGQCALDQCATQAYLLIQCRAFDNPCRPFMLDVIRQWTGVKESGSSASSSTSSYYPINRGDASPPWTWVFVLIFGGLIVALGLWTFLSIFRRRRLAAWWPGS